MCLSRVNFSGVEDLALDFRFAPGFLHYEQVSRSQLMGLGGPATDGERMATVGATTSFPNLAAPHSS